MAAFACGDDTTSSATGAGGTGGGTSTGGAGGGELTCKQRGGDCVAIPAGWKGPVRINDDVATCTSTAFNGGFDAESLVQQDPICACDCVAEGAGCTVTATLFSDAACSTMATAQSLELPDGVCTAAPTVEGADAGSFTVAVTSTSGSCVSDEVPADVPTISFEPTVVGCNVPIYACEDELDKTCIPSTATYCLYSETETACPDGFTDQHTLYASADVTDTRACGCTCDALDVGCAPSAAAWSDAACSVSQAVSDAMGCTTVTAPSALAALTVDAQLTATCGAPTTAISGGLELTGTGLLVCCH